MKVASWLLPIASLLAVAWFTWMDLRDGGTGPGPLHPAHAVVAVLERGARCEACHAPGAGIDAARCVACHDAIGAQLAAGAGLHGGLGADVVRRCERCHSEHHGAEAPLIAPFAFPRAGVADATRYDHAHVAFGLRGAHDGLACTTCHPHADDPMPPAGGRFVGASQQCTACHRDAHGGAFGSGCADCHGQEEPWSAAPHFAHAQLPLAGGHARVACAACHAPGSEREVAAVRRQAAPARTCRACHDDPHDGIASTKPDGLRLAGTSDCARCHDTTAWRSARPTGAQHAALGFELHGRHAEAACAACHGDAGRAARWSGAVPEAGDCAVCHSSPHGEALLATARCEQCHHADDATFAAGRITAAAHAATGFALVPPHTIPDCRRCHAGVSWPERYPGRAAADCRACHADVHGGQFAESRWRQCSACHAGEHFVPHQFGREAHSASAFPLAGAHDAVACNRCHTLGNDGRRQFVGTPRTCASCHADVHAGAFTRPGLPTAIDNRTDCARCHGTASFAELTAPFDHGTWTGYALDGAHARAACSACHQASGARRHGKAAGTSCASCHADPHSGQFRRDGGAATDCSRCHAPTTFAELRFDHRRDSRFALDGAHASLACSRCHVGVAVGGRDVVRYRPLGTSCSDCHRLGVKGGR